jgi:putative glutamine amidotransferase
MKPRIAIPQHTSANLAYNQRSWPAYAAAVTRSGGEAVAIDITYTSAEINALAATCDGVLLPGSPADVDPALYGADREPASSPADRARETADRLLLDHAAKCAKPVLGICYGLQSLNVWSGGSLLQDLAPVPVNHAAGANVAVAHTALVAPDSLLATLLSGDEAPEIDGFLRLPVNSSHHQAIAVPGEGLRVAARCPDDGVIEAVELVRGRLMFHVDHPAQLQVVLGVQWHPERSYEASAGSRALFTHLIAQAQPFADARSSAL